MAKKYKFGIVASCYNKVYVDAVVASAQKALHDHKVTVVRVPGAFEIPLQVQRLANSRKYDAILALGVVWQGRTAHAAELVRVVSDSLMKIALKSNVPVIHQVLSVKTEKEATERTSGKELNRGREAAETAMAVAALKG
jgi:6,7-dimethyl-8-ribityllumazine synthase